MDVKIKTLLPIPNGYKVVYYDEMIDEYGIVGVGNSYGCPMIAITATGEAKIAFYNSATNEFEEDRPHGCLYELVPSTWLLTNKVEDVFS